MKSMFLIGLAMSVFVGSVSACASCSQDEQEEQIPENSVVAKAMEVIREWNDAHTMHDSSMLGELYANVVYYYTYLQEKELCLKDKDNLFKKYPEFRQTVSEFIDIDYEGGVIKCSFIKNVFVNNVQTQYDSYLYLYETDGRFRIIREGDMSTDNNVKAKSDRIAVPSSGCMTGDFDGDGNTESAWLDVKDLTDGKGYIRFSKSTVPSIPVETYHEVKPINLHDLNGDGADDIGLNCFGMHSIWSSFNVYSFMNGKWCKPIDSFPVHETLWEMIGSRNPVEIASANNKTVNVYYTEQNAYDDDFMAVKRKTVPVRYYKGYVNRLASKSVAIHKPLDVNSNNVVIVVKERNAPETTIVRNIYDVMVSASDWEKAFDDNKFAAEEKYKGKRIAVYGKISSIDESLFGDPYIALDAGLFSSVICYFPDDDVSKKVLARLSSGETVTIIGTCKGSTSSLNNCRLLD